MEAAGKLRRVAKGVYHAPKQTLLGPAKPSPLAIATKVLSSRVRPFGVTAANMLGLTSQVSGLVELVVYGQSKFESPKVRTKRRTRTSVANVQLLPEDSALLEVLRDRGKFSELSARETILRVQSALLANDHDTDELLLDTRRMRNLVNVALEEPPRVRAILGALLEDLNVPMRLWKPLRHSLNPLSRFDFGVFRELPNSKDWQAK